MFSLLALAVNFNSLDLPSSWPAQDRNNIWLPHLPCSMLDIYFYFRHVYWPGCHTTQMFTDSKTHMFGYRKFESRRSRGIWRCRRYWQVSRQNSRRKIWEEEMRRMTRWCDADGEYTWPGIEIIASLKLMEIVCEPDLIFNGIGGTLIEWEKCLENKFGDNSILLGSPLSVQVVSHTAWLIATAIAEMVNPIFRGHNFLGQ